MLRRRPAAREPPAAEPVDAFTPCLAWAWALVALRIFGVPPLGHPDAYRAEEGLTFTQVAANSLFTVLLRSDGIAVVFGGNYDGQCNIPALDPGVTYTQVAAGEIHTVMLRSDGTAVACGNNSAGQCSIPALDAGLTYTQVAAGKTYTVLLRSDGTAVALSLIHI